MSSFLFLLRDSLQKTLLLSPLPLLVILLTVIAPPGRSPVSADGTFAQPHSVQQSLPNGASPSWYQSAMNEIERSEYEIRWQEHVSAYQSPNRRQNLRFTYHADGFTVTPRQRDNISGPRPSSHGNPTDWSITFALAKIEKGSDAIEFSGRTLHVEKNTASIEDDNLQITYANNEEGMRQNFIVKHFFSRDDSPLTLQMSLDTDLDYDTHGTGILFRNHDREEVLRYNRLKAWDAEGRILDAKIQGHGGADRSTFAVIVDDRNASYPITIDPLSSTEDWTAGSSQASSYFGYSVSTAGSVNGDGYSDIIIGAPYYDNGQTNEGRAYVYYGSSSGFPALADWVAESNQANAFFGVSVSTAGSVNGDNYSDIIVGANKANGASITEGSVSVWHGSPTGLPDGSPNWTASSGQMNADFGVSVSTAGDVNGDGYSDVIVGSLYYDNGETDEGRVFVWYGSSTGLGPPPGVPFNPPDWTAESNQAAARFGWTVSTAGDVNGDGYSDIIVGADAYDNGQTNEGRVFVWHGSSTGLGTSGTPTNADWTAESNQASARLGFSVSTAGDVNGDGYSDIIVGADSCDNGQSNEGRAFVWHGSSTGLGTSGTPSNADWSAESNQASALFGYSVSIAGDVNGDGYADVIVGAPDYDNGETNEGRSYVYHGSSTGLSTSANWIHESNQNSAAYGCCVRTAGDVNADGCSDVLIGARNYDNSSTDEGRVFVYNGAPSGLSEMTTANWMTESNQASSQYGFAVSSAGDVNGDGYSDIIVGAYYFDNGESDEGRAYVFHGSSQGPSATPTWTAEANQASALFGISVSSAGDVNGDGYSDIIVGAQYYDNPETNEGAAFVWHGSASGLGANGTPSNADWFAESNQSSPRFARIVATAGDVNGDGYSDVLVGAAEYDSGQSNEGKVFLWYGSASGLGPSGTPLNADWTAESNQASAYYGFAASTAGDVNGDGFSDVLVGAYFYDNPEANEGMAFVYLGGASGPSTSADWFAESNQDGALLGNSVSTAGDVNGDGYSDIIIGADSYDDVQANAGRAFVWFGSSTGLGANGTPSNAEWWGQVNFADSEFGQSVSTAGDVNGDGYSDIILGAPKFESSTAEPDEGMAFVWHGSQTGLGNNGSILNADWKMDQNQTDASFGIAVSCAGDVNGDGYSDVIVGARYYTNVENNEGAAYVFLGGGGGGLSLVPRQWRTDLTTPVVMGLKTRAPNQVGLGLRGRTFFGRSEVQIIYEVKPLGTPFDGLGALAGPRTDVGTSGAAMNLLINGLTERTLYKWRARISYRLSDGATQVRGRWIYPNANGGLGEADFQVSADDVPLPVEILSMSASAHGTTAVLHWITATELNNYGFEIERRTVGLLGTQGDGLSGIWEIAGFVNGSGTSAKPVEYTFEDTNLPDGCYAYRIKQIDKDGSHRYTDAVEVSVGDVPTVFSLDQNYPNPFNPTTTIQFGLPQPSKVKIVLYDLLGKAVKTIVEKELPLGYHRVEFDGGQFASSVYFYRLTAEDLEGGQSNKFVQTRKMILLR